MSTRNNPINSKTVELKIPGKFHISPLPSGVLASAKCAFTTRNVPTEEMQTVLTGNGQPHPGDLVLARVDRIRQHARLELPNGRRSRLFPGDTIVAVYGNRYAPDQFESLVPEGLSACHLVAGGGVVSRMRHRSPKVKPPTEITPIGLVGDATGRRLNTRDWLNPDVTPGNPSPWGLPVFLVVGSSMNAGKTTTAARLIRGLTEDGYRVGAIKVTGTGSGGDLWHFVDAGARHALDFTDTGYVSTYQSGATACLNIFESLGASVCHKGMQALVVEVADGILQKETAALLSMSEFKRRISAVWYCAGDSGSALFGVDWLQNQGYEVEAVSGVVSSNPLAAAEVQQHCEVPVVGKSALAAAGSGHSLMEKFVPESSRASAFAR